ncbi:MAG TPA: GntR family transcriptional regulator [Pseudolabrys sp.]|jgi:GntR family transcriptional regulator|nr:GntR family transcriptional regulator [Pseudolabrys sp.]
MFELSKVYDRSRVPLYIQVASVMRRRIETKQWSPGQKIPTLVELEREFQVARVTIRQAVDILREEGLLRSQQGRGTFAAEKPVDRHWFKLATTWDVLIESIKDNVLKRIKVDDPPPFPMLREEEGQLADSYVFLRSVQYKDDQPYGIVNLHLAKNIYKQSPEAFRQHPALTVIAEAKDIDIQHAHQTVVIGSADPTTSDLLQIALGAPTAECRCVLIDRKNVAIYVADIIYRSDAIQLHIDLLAHLRTSPDNGRRNRSSRK